MQSRTLFSKRFGNDAKDEEDEGPDAVREMTYSIRTAVAATA